MMRFDTKPPASDPFDITFTIATSNYYHFQIFKLKRTEN